MKKCLTMIGLKQVNILEIFTTLFLFTFLSAVNAILAHCCTIQVTIISGFNALIVSHFQCQIAICSFCDIVLNVEFVFVDNRIMQCVSCSKKQLPLTCPSEVTNFPSWASGLSDRDWLSRKLIYLAIHWNLIVLNIVVVVRKFKPYMDDPFPHLFSDIVLRPGPHLER